MPKFEYTLSSHVTIVVQADNEEIAEKFCLDNWDELADEKFGNLCHKDWMLEEPLNVTNFAVYNDFDGNVKVNSDGTFEVLE